MAPASPHTAQDISTQVAYQPRRRRLSAAPNLSLHSSLKALVVLAHEGVRAIRSTHLEGVRSPRAPIVCLCGSTRFKAAFEYANRTETLAGRMVLSVGVFGHADAECLSEHDKGKLDALHLRKIDLADEILVINVGGYIGESTRREIAYAKSRAKDVRYLEDITTTEIATEPQPPTAVLAQSQ